MSFRSARCRLTYWCPRSIKELTSGSYEYIYCANHSAVACSNEKDVSLRLINFHSSLDNDLLSFCFSPSLIRSKGRQLRSGVAISI